MPQSKTISELFQQFKTSPQGLTHLESQKRLQKYGENAIVGKKKRPLLLEFLDEFKDLMVLLLIFASIISAIGREYRDAGVILFIVILNAIIGFIQKYKAEKAIEALRKLVAPHAKVIREGKLIDIEAKNIVPGDILVLHEGDRVGADARIIEERELEIQESVLTGESSPVQKNSEIIGEKELSLAEHENLVFMGTSVTHGTGKAVVIATGMQTEFGKIAHLTTTTKKDKSPLQQELQHIGIFVGKLTVVISTILFLIGYLIQKTKFVEAFLFASSVAVAAVPEGLPATITIALALGVQKLARKNAIMKQLASVETLGSTTVICTDKTGTLTKNEMTVTEILLNGYEINITGTGYNPKGCLNIKGQGQLISLAGYGNEEEEESQIEKTKHFSLDDLKNENPHIYKITSLVSRIGALCNNAKLSQRDHAWEIIGDPTEGALLTVSEKSGFSQEYYEKFFSRVYEHPFDSGVKRMTTIIQESKDKTISIYSKGAPDIILGLCTEILTPEGIVKPLDSHTKTEFLEKNKKMAEKALRVLGFAYKKLPEGTEVQKKYNREESEKDLVFVGLVGMIDPPRPEVKKAVSLTKTAGIKTYIITGDNGLTASAIAKEVGLIGNTPKIIEGTELKKMAVQSLLKNFRKYAEIIFARVSPEDKLKIVNALKNRGEIVAMTGDGVNDAPALKRADIGISMGISGTDVSKEAANMVLADDSYGTIVSAVKEGRTIYQNLKKFIFYIFSSNIGELFTIFGALALNIPGPLTAILILSVNVGTDVLPAIAIGVDPPSKDVMNQKPRNPQERIMKKNFILHFAALGSFVGIVIIGMYIYTLYRYGWTWGEPLSRDSLTYLKGSTVTFVSLVLIQMLNAFNARSAKRSIFSLGFFSNKWLLGAVALSIGLVIMLVEINWLADYIHTTDLTLQEWGMVVLASFTVVVFEEVRKMINRKRNLEARI